MDPVAYAVGSRKAKAVIDATANEVKAAIAAVVGKVLNSTWLLKKSGAGEVLQKAARIAGFMRRWLDYKAPQVYMLAP